MSTKELARSLGLIQKLSSSTKKSVAKVKKQPFTYLVVIDFESTCWKDKRMSSAPEIIEFPAVLIHTSTGVIESEFHHYVQPSEHPKLSDFCKELTGITQTQVDNGIPIGTCLMLFNNWLQKLKDDKNIKFLSDVLKATQSEQMDVNWCTFVTWSDWDIGICLKNECQRKRHLTPQPLRSWIDLRATYKTFYSRKPNGLAGALNDLGIQFLGRQHFGLDDARNTALLAWRMIKDGCVMNVSSSIEASVSVLHEIIQNGFKRTEHPKEPKRSTLHSSGAENDSKKNDNQPSTKNSMQKIDSNSVYSGRDRVVETSNQKTNGSDSCVLEATFNKQESKDSFAVSCGEDKIQNVTSSGQSLLSQVFDDEAKALVAPATCLTGMACFTKVKSACMSTSVSMCDGSHNPSAAKRGLKQSLDLRLFSTKRLNGVSTVKNTTASNALAKKYCLAIENSLSYNQVNTKLNNSVGLKRNCKASNVSEFNPKTPRLVDRINLLSDRHVDALTNSRAPGISTDMKRVAQLTGTGITPVINQQNGIANADEENGGKNVDSNRVVFKTPRDVNLLKRTLLTAHGNNSITQYSSLKSKGAVTSKNLRSPNCVTPFSLRGGVTPLLRYNGGSVTAPLCSCGRRARRLTVGKPGPNHGRVFYSCSVRNNRLKFGKSPVKVAKTRKSCNFFCWEPFTD